MQSLQTNWSAASMRKSLKIILTHEKEDLLC